jgi:hypothetical protein
MKHIEIDYDSEEVQRLVEFRKLTKLMINYHKTEVEILEHKLKSIDKRLGVGVDDKCAKVQDIP